MNRMGIRVPQKWRELYIVRSIQTAERSYTPKFLDEKLVIFRGAGLYDHDPGMGWSKLAREIDEHVIGTAPQQKSRRDILNEPLVLDVANELKRLMDETVKADVPPRAAAAPAHTGHELERPQDAA